MVQDEKDQDVIRRYLLGVLEEPEQHELEQRLLTDKEFSEELQIAEDELVDDYLAETLTSDERLQFEAHFLAAPERRDDLKFSRAFKQYVASASLSPVAGKKARTAAPEPVIQSVSFWKRPAFVYSAIAATVIALSIGGWLIWPSKTSPARREQIEQELAQLNERNRDVQSATETPSDANRTLLTPGLVRGAGDTKRVEVSSQANPIEVDLEVPNMDFVSYQATIVSEGAELYSVTNLHSTLSAGMSMVRLQLLPKYLPRGDYQVKLIGKSKDGNSEHVGSYPFRLVVK